MKERSQAGFSYIDVMIAIVILMVGILALLSAISASILLSKGQENQLQAKQIVTSTMESIMSVKESSDYHLGWYSIGNVGSNPWPLPTSAPAGIFVVGFQSVTENPGHDQIWGTADDSGPVIDGFRRQVTITDVCDPDRPSPNCDPPSSQHTVRIRRVEVLVNYFIGATPYQERATTILTDYAIEE